MLVGCFVCFQYHREKKFKADELNARLQLVNLYILEQLAAGGDAGRITASPLYPFEDLRISVIDTAGHVVYDNTLDTLPGTGHLSRQEIAQAFRNGAGYTVRRHSQSTGKTYFYSATWPGKGYLVRSAVPYTVSLRELLRADLGFLWIMGSITLFMCILGYFATRRVGLLILRLNKFAESAERGEQIYDTAPFPQDELGAISNHIVRLYANLQQANIERDREHKAALNEQQEKERIKKQLTNNINHELKTPVASMQVCLETLMAHPDMSEAKREEFLSRCLVNNQRLKQLLSDVSLITRMDEAPASIVREPVDLTGIISEVVADLDVVALGKGMDIIQGVTAPLPMIGNASLLASVFRNLLDNAIAYSGGTQVAIETEPSTETQIILTVTDNGCGVAPEHLPRLFERFYRVDKGRSRLAGGTGLGLSIVKNAVQLHNGTITVSNHPHGGLCFKIIFNKTL